MQPKKNIQAHQKENRFQQIERMHPYKMLLFLGIIGISMIFVFLVIAYTVSMSKSSLLEQFQLPKIFTLGTIVLLISSFSINAAGKAFDEDNMPRLHQMILWTFLMGLIFAGCQLLGWLALKENGVFLAGQSSGTFLYILSGLHLMHLSGGTALLIAAMVKSFKVRRDPVKALIMVTNPFEKLRLDLLTIYWHFLSGLWLLLFFYFLITF